MAKSGADVIGIDSSEDQIIAAKIRASGKLLIAYFVWLPEEDEIARASENLVLSFNPNWTVAGFAGKPEILTDIGDTDFELDFFCKFRIYVEYSK